MDEIAWDDLEYGLDTGRPLRFRGSDADVARAFFLAWTLLREKIEAGGIVGIDYEKLAMPSNPSPGGGFGGWLEGAFGQVVEFEEIALEVIRDCEPERVQTWVQMRRPDHRVSSKKLAERTGRAERTLRADAALLDRCLAGAMRRRGYSVGG